ncbi:hypothetical protein F5X68DRAFT_4441 [Plectosphaerella plurivora]|uniref:Uncharacterized protein n=1 Tax=Plectosphaerella plurivora TaxID=936078 RepID=A0A9P9AII5_9PEZI|nr:hypothetical protein F5X68DRAFT_4441 [Plectosphaerella plurivora]
MTVPPATSKPRGALHSHALTTHTTPHPSRLASCTLPGRSKALGDCQLFPFNDIIFPSLGNTYTPSPPPSHPPLPPDPKSQTTIFLPQQSSLSFNLRLATTDRTPNLGINNTTHEQTTYGACLVIAEPPQALHVKRWNRALGPESLTGRFSPCHWSCTCFVHTYNPIPQHPPIERRPKVRSCYSRPLLSPSFLVAAKRQSTTLSNTVNPLGPVPFRILSSHPKPTPKPHQPKVLVGKGPSKRKPSSTPKRRF